MKNNEKINAAFKYFKKGYAYKMGGTQTVVLPNGKRMDFDDRAYYSGRGSKYNKNVRHDCIGVVKVSRQEYSEYLKSIGEDRGTKARMKSFGLVWASTVNCRFILTVQQSKHLKMVRKMEAKKDGYTMRYYGFEFRIPNGEKKNAVRREVNRFMKRIAPNGEWQLKNFIE